MGGYWGLLDGAAREPKYPAGAAISNYPFWKLQMASGLVLHLRIRSRFPDAEAPALSVRRLSSGSRWRYPQPLAEFCWA